ncbi:hypothetical protein D5086_010415 [Populus alba]|uniref:Uncharacterized protein n=1 Tax=Populus alba TaxID=43335 RepID=A0ACC4CAK0_POPAL
MAAEVSSLVRLLSGYTDDRNVVSESGGAKSTTLITRDLLGGGGGGGDSVESESQELDLDLQVPSGWEKRLDLKITLNLFDEGNLELNFVSSPMSSNYQSVCTLDRVKSALERAEKEPGRKQSSSLWKSSLSPPYSSSSSSVRDIQDEENEEKLLEASPVAAGCPGCLSYVLITKINPRCPRCNSVVQMPMMKKPMIDLNISI